eukprot:12319560-Prorocentrum_lima.AAC.1
MSDIWVKRVSTFAGQAGKQVTVTAQEGLVNMCGVGGATRAIRSRLSVRRQQCFSISGFAHNGRQARRH